MDTFWASIVVFGVLIFFHELGHFAVAKAVNIKVHEFSLGFGPRIAGLTRGETTYNLRLLPLGGFVRMAGMNPEEDEVEDERGFNKKTVFQRASVIFAGPLMNFVLAIVLLAVIFMTQGIPTPTTSIDQLVPEQPAQTAGLLPGDEITGINGERVQSWTDISDKIASSPGRSLTVEVKREGVDKTFTLVPVANEKGLGKIGVYPAQVTQPVGLLESLARGAEYTARVSWMIIDFIGKMITGSAPADLGGPVRVISEINKAVGMGVYHLLQLGAFLSINLGLFNLFPIPALDGSRIMFLGLERLRGRPVDPKKENFIHLVGFGMLLLLIVVITYNDVVQLL